MANNVKKLYRSSTDKVIFGVCGGLADYLEVDSLVIRIIFLLLVLAGGSGIFVYLILALVMPKETGKEKIDLSEELRSPAETLAQNIKERRLIVCIRNIAGIIIVLIGLSLLFKEIFKVELFGWLEWKTIIALVLVLFGVNIIRNQNK